MITLYSTGCSACKMLKKKLDAKGIQYTENNSVEEMKSLNIINVPVLKVEDKLLSLGEANNWINNQ